jgi:hypothetical protein
MIADRNRRQRRKPRRTGRATTCPSVASLGDYAGFDRVVDHLWYAYAVSADRDRYTYGYDRASNRLYRENTLTTGQDELYGYEGVDRLIAFQRGDLNANKDGITGTAAREEDWSLDMTGNWPGYVQKTSGSTDLDQGRTHNAVNLPAIRLPFYSGFRPDVPRGLAMDANRPPVENSRQGVLGKRILGKRMSLGKKYARRCRPTVGDWRRLSPRSGGLVDSPFVPMTQRNGLMTVTVSYVMPSSRSSL